MLMVILSSAVLCMQNMERDGRKNNVMTDSLVSLGCLMSYDVLRLIIGTFSFKYLTLDSIGLIDERNGSLFRGHFLSSEF
jgi:hypothetical protein